MSDETTKKPWMSRTIIGCAVTLLAVVLQFKGIDIGEEKKLIVDTIFQLMEVGGIGLAIFGRVKAKSKIALK